MQPPEPEGRDEGDAWDGVVVSSSPTYSLSPWRDAAPQELFDHLGGDSFVTADHLERLMREEEARWAAEQRHAASLGAVIALLRMAIARVRAMEQARG